MWPTGFTKRRARQQWEQALAWFRLRYLDPAGPTRCLRLLSRPAACGRVALYYRPGDGLVLPDNGLVLPDDGLAELYLGVPPGYVRLLQRMAADFHCLLAPGPAPLLPAVQQLATASQLPWTRPFMAHIVAEQLFVNVAGDGALGEARQGSYLPQPPRRGAALAGWSLPAEPPPGLTARPVWRDVAPLSVLQATPDAPGWPVGRGAGRHDGGDPWLQLAGRLNLYGRPTAAADWLVAQVTHLVNQPEANLVVLDGTGDLVPRLKRKAAVTRQLGERLTYVDIDGASLVGGLNPLAPVPGETAAAQLLRWQRWFGGMQVHPQGIELLAQAQQAGVGDIPALQKWLRLAERQAQTSAVGSLSLALTRLMTSRNLREWLTWPSSPWSQKASGVFLFACQANSWERRHLLRAVLLVAASQPTRPLLVHGYPWSAFGVEDVSGCASVLISNGPPLPGAAAVLVQAEPALAAAVGQRYLNGEGRLVEGLQLLQPGEGLIVADGGWFFAAWERRLAGFG